jgi:outer membrane lipoprotein-sorting protein
MKKYRLLVMIVISVIAIAGFARALAIELSADTITTGKGKQTHTSKMYLKGEKYRMEMPGQHQYIILRQDKNVMWIVMPDNKSFMEMPFDPKQKPRIEEKQTGEVSRKLIDSENIDGHPTQKYEVTVREATKIEKFYQWMATDIHFPIKIAAIDGSWSVDYKNIKTSVSDMLFEVPAGYQKRSLPTMPGMGGAMKGKPLKN